MPMTFNLSDKLLRCVANVPTSNFTDVQANITVAFNKCTLLTHLLLLLIGSAKANILKINLVILLANKFLHLSATFKEKRYQFYVSFSNCSGQVFNCFIYMAL